jgi:hypothetical protein
VNAICTWPVELSAGVARIWLAPLLGHSIAWPPEAAASLTTASGEKPPCPDRLSSSTTSAVPPPELLLDEELLELEELLLDEELLDEELDEEGPLSPKKRMASAALTGRLCGTPCMLIASTGACAPLLP